MGPSGKTLAAIHRVAGYVPFARIERSKIAEVWSAPMMPGERAICGGDEDTITMGVDAAERCLEGVDRTSIDGVYFASTSAPYAERHAAAIIAMALDLPGEVATVDFGDTLRAGTAALRAARDAVVSGNARSVLVVVSDRRVAEPESVFEQLFGDSAAAVLVGPDGPGALLRIISITSHADDVITGWRRSEDPYFRSFSPKHEMEYGFRKPLVHAIGLAAEATKIDLSKARLALPTIDGRIHYKVAKDVGVGPDRLTDPMALAIGVPGAPAPFLALASTVEMAEEGDTIVMAAAGEGADAVVLELVSKLRPGDWRFSSDVMRKRVVASYGELIRSEGLMDVAGPRIDSSTVTYWRGRRRNQSLHGMKCTDCGLVQYPAARVCQRCRAVDSSEDVALSRHGAVFTYTFDHVVAASYSMVPVIRVIVDLEGGGRIMTQLTECQTDDVKIGMAVDLTFRSMNEGGDFKNYYWKARPARERAAKSAKEAA